MYFMKKSILSLLFASMMLAFTACGGGSSEGTPAAGGEGGKNGDAAMALLESVEFTPEGLKSMIKTPEGEEMTETEYRAVMLAYSKCEFKDEDLTMKSTDQTKALREILKDHKKPGNYKDIDMSLANHESPQVRYMVMGKIFTFLLGTSDSGRKQAMDVLKNEKDLHVIRQGIEQLSNDMAKDKEIADFIMGNAKNDNAVIRGQVASALGSSWNKEVAGVYDALVELMGDKEQKVRGKACRAIGTLNDDRAVAELVKVLNNPEENKIHGDACEGLVKMFFDYPMHKNTNAAAYKAYLDYLKKTPRSKEIPNWTALTKVRNAGNNAFEWQQKATYFKPAEIVAVFSDVAKDANADWLGRSAALDAVSNFGQKSDLESIKKALESNSSDSKASLIIDKLNKLIEKKQ